ncbi:MAG: hypothetical protein QOF78_971 [Phycisphaerales bacterium]|jgi:HK97 family phage major capsid protein|nr:hypothetical protein [Phycisphaerales bacterium]
MWQKIKAAREQFGQSKAEMQEIITRSEGRALSAEEQKAFDAAEVRARESETAIRNHERFESVDRLQRIGMTPDMNRTFGERDLSKYSLVRAINRRMNGQSLDGIEKEVNDELSIRNGKQAQGFYFPTELGMERRDLTLTTGAGAKPTLTDPANFIEYLRAKTIASALGVTFLAGLTGDLSLPKQSAASTAYWVTEGSAPTESNAQIGQVALAPKTVGAFTDFSRKFLIQSSISAENFAREELARTVGTELDRVVFNGSGSGAEPTGILQAAGVSTVALGTNGDAPSWAKLVEMESAVAASNADVGSLAYVMTSAARGKLKVVEKASGTARFLWDDNNTINGYAAHATNQIPSNLTKGSGTSLSAAIFGNFRDVVIGLWSGIDILVDPYTGGTSGNVRVVALQDVDVKLRHAESFAKIVDMVTT